MSLHFLVNLKSDVDQARRDATFHLIGGMLGVESVVDMDVVSQETLVNVLLRKPEAAKEAPRKAKAQRRIMTPTEGSTVGGDTRQELREFNKEYRSLAERMKGRSPP